FLLLRDPPLGGHDALAHGARGDHVPGKIEREAFFKGAARMFRSRSILAAYAANGVLVFVAGTMIAWLPSFFNRVYGLSTQAASVRGALVLLASGVGWALCGFWVDRLARHGRRAVFLGPAAIAGAVALLLGIAFQLRPGPLQFALLMVGALGLAGTQG